MSHWELDRAAASPRTYHPGQPGAGLPQPAGAPREPFYPWPPAPHPVGLSDAAEDDAERAGAGDGGLPGGRRWLIPAGIVAAAVVGAAAVLLTGGHQGTGGVGAVARPATEPTTKTTGVTVSRPPGADASAPLTVPQAQSVLARYTAANNSANHQRNSALLAAVETGSSYAIDAGTYQAQAAERTATTYPAFSPVQATFYIPGGEPASGPRWFVAQVANAFLLSPSNVTSDEYLLFVQSTPGGSWRNAIEPYLLPTASAPQVAVGDGGLATAVPEDATAFTVAPGQLPAVTAASLDGRGADGGHAAVVNPGNLADLTNQEPGQAGVPAGTVSDTHAAAAGAEGQEFALLTTDGGALVFYTDAAKVSGTRPAAGRASSAGRPLTQVRGASYLEQFATYDPPAGGGVPRIIADYSGITAGS